MAIVEKFPDVAILCVGDVMLDQFTDGVIKRISPESPVPIFSAGKSAMYPGGAANVARNITALGGRCTLISVIGEDETGQILARELEADGGIDAILLKCADRPTTEKTRYVTQGQHVLRVDREVAKPLTKEDEDRVLAVIEANISSSAVLLLSDYAKGVLTDRVVSGAIELARRHGRQVVVDPKSKNFARYAGATVITPNNKEIEAGTGIEAVDNATAVEAGLAALHQADVEAVLVTRAEHGMTLVPRGGAAVHISSRAREVADVVGAGDTVIATLALALGAGSNLAEAARIANAAAGISVSHHGTSTVSPGELLDELVGIGVAHLRPHASKIMGWKDIALCRKAWKRSGQKVVFTNGCFDILHLGHIRLLEFARSNGEKLVVGLNSDASVRRLKGPTRPINLEMDRAEVLASLETVDAVVLFEQDTPRELIETIDPDVLVKGADYEVGQIVGSDFVSSRGGKVVRFALVEGKSSTNIINAVK